AQLTPQTHEAGEMGGAGAISGTVTDVTGAVIPGATVTLTALDTNVSTTQTTSSDGSYAVTGLAPGLYTLTVMARGFLTYRQSNVTVSGQESETVNVSLNVGAVNETVTVMAAQPTAARKKVAHGGVGSGAGIGPGYGENIGGGIMRNSADVAYLTNDTSGASGVDRASDAFQEGDVTTNAFDEFFEYALTQPVTIHKNESAMVPILQQALPAEHVTLWSEKEPAPLRAVWLENNSKLTLDSGSFSIFESGEFAGEGLLDPIHPGEKRLLSYAADQAVRVKVTARDNRRTLRHVKITEGVVVETYMNVASVTYSAVNSADLNRVVLIEHSRINNGWSLDGDLKPAETSPNLYRFKLPVEAHSTATLEVRERGPVNTEVRLNPNYNQSVYLLDLVKRAPDALDKLKPLIDAQTALADLDRRISESRQTENAASADEARDRENLTALKGNDAAKRFVDELNRAEDQLQAAHKQTIDLEQQKKAAVDKLNEMISQISFDWDVKAEK
ncbi:MAG TPA: carboxypeptidase regulatory-like domain-containing protein, partial [Terracidiphilus sp.]|nr:carboxypeptidase regulatory-like domain-containing protein [Terracidiphilus sp.]